MRLLPQAHQSTKAVRFELARASPEPQKDATCLAGHGANVAGRPAGDAPTLRLGSGSKRSVASNASGGASSAGHGRQAAEGEEATGP